MAGVIHQAGALDADGVQRCVRCGFELCDYREVKILNQQRAWIMPVGWRTGRAVRVHGGNPRYAHPTAGRPNCVDWRPESRP